jgi:flagellar protein FliL
MNKTVGIIVGLALLLCVGAAAGAWWWVQQQSGGAADKAAPTVQLDASQPNYLTLDKIVVMLRPEPDRTHNTYVSVDLVFRTDKTHAKAFKGELPMLKGVAVRTLSKLDVAQARNMAIEEWTDLLSRDLMAAYEQHLSPRMFDQVMVSRLIIE